MIFTSVFISRDSGNMYMGRHFGADCSTVQENFTLADWIVPAQNCSAKEWERNTICNTLQFDYARTISTSYIPDYTADYIHMYVCTCFIVHVRHETALLLACHDCVTCSNAGNHTLMQSILEIVLKNEEKHLYCKIIFIYIFLFSELLFFLATKYRFIYVYTLCIII